MGMNLYIVKMPEEKHVDWWDCSRIVKDYEFAGADIDCEYKNIDDMYVAFRPKNFDEARKWVLENIPHEDNEGRLITGLNRMEKDATLWFEYY